jgi:pimeloyl-ACP methyl ester carboxylesterase
MRRKPFIILSIFLLSWLVTAQSCMKMRISDTKAVQEFREAGVVLHTEDFDVDGFNLHAVHTGNDTLPTLFFIHGSPGSWNAFEVYLKDKDLLKKYRMYSIDRPGFGYSQFGNDMNMEDQAQIIYSFINSIKNGKPLYIIGHSLGGPILVKLAADHPDDFKGMVILAGSIDADEEPKELWRGLLYYTPLQYFMPGAFRPSSNEIWAFKKELKDLDDEIRNISCDVYVVHGDKDTFVPVGNAYYAQKAMINARSFHLKILKGAPHFIPWEPWYGEVKEVLMNMN